MNITVVLTLFYFVSIVAQEDSWILWVSSRKLNWEDFQGQGSKSEYKAETHWRIYYDFQISLIQKKPFLSDYNVRTEFSRNKSWVKQGGGSQQLLRHEQGHFDLAEIYARKFRARLDSLSFRTPNYQNEIDSLFHLTLTHCDQVQNSYDLETEHGLVLQNQIKWEALFQTELNALQDYSYYE